MQRGYGAVGDCVHECVCVCVAGLIGVAPETEKYSGEENGW